MIVAYTVLRATMQALFWVVLVNALLSWVPGLAAQSTLVAAVQRVTARVADPLLAPIRRRMPGGVAIDFSPLILMLLLQVADAVLARLLLP